jgi:hypothetical protein
MSSNGWSQQRYSHQSGTKHFRLSPNEIQQLKQKREAEERLRVLKESRLRASRVETQNCRRYEDELQLAKEALAQSLESIQKTNKQMEIYRLRQKLSEVQDDLVGRAYFDAQECSETFDQSNLKQVHKLEHMYYTVDKQRSNEAYAKLMEQRSQENDERNRRIEMLVESRRRGDVRANSNVSIKRVINDYSLKVSKQSDNSHTIHLTDKSTQTSTNKCQNKKNTIRSFE